MSKSMEKAQAAIAALMTDQNIDQVEALGALVFGSSYLLTHKGASRLQIMSIATDGYKASLDEKKEVKK